MQSVSLLYYDRLWIPLDSDLVKAVTESEQESKSEVKAVLSYNFKLLLKSMHNVYDSNII